jgi:hypothetical protein
MSNARLFLAVAAVIAVAACSKSESGKPDSAAAAAAATPSAPAAVTAADMAVPATGKVMPTNSDSVLDTFVCSAGSAPNTSVCVNSTKDTVTYTYTLSGADSVMFESAPFTPKAPPKSPKLINHVVGHLAGNQWTGTATSVLAAKPDSVVQRTRWTATKGQ